MFYLSSYHHDNKMLNQMIFISDFSCSFAFYLTFLFACKLLCNICIEIIKVCAIAKTLYVINAQRFIITQHLNVIQTFDNF